MMTKKEKLRYQRAIVRATKALISARALAMASIQLDMERRVHDPRTSFGRVEQVQQAFTKGQLFRDLDEALRLTSKAKESFF